MIPKIGDKLYFICHNRVVIFEILGYEIEIIWNEQYYRFEVGILLGSWPRNSILISKRTLMCNQSIVPIIGEYSYIIFDEKVFVNYIRTHEIT